MSPTLNPAPSKAFQDRAARELLFEHYGLEPEGELTPLARDGLFFFEAKGQGLILKRHNPLTRANLGPLLKIYALASNKGLIPTVRPTRQGRLLAQDEGLIFSVQEHKKNASKRPPELGLVSARLARLHAVLADLETEPFCNHLQRVVPDVAAAAKAWGYGRLVPFINQAQEILTQERPQVVHGDLHPGNVIFDQREVWFIDLDSAATLAAASDVAFAAFRFGGLDGFEEFVRGYNRAGPPQPMSPRGLASLVVYQVLQRLLFILIEAAAGREEWLVDLENQKRFLNLATQRLGRG